MDQLIALSPADVTFLAALAFAAGLVRGFSGFALSALLMSGAVLVLPPIQVIPICWVLEMVASALMVRGGWQEADRPMVVGLTAGSALGVPIGLAVTGYLPAEGSKLAALALIIVLAALQLAKIRLPFLATKPGLYGSGVLSGFATGIAAVGGMVVALYILNQDAKARVIRASLVMYLLLSSLFTFLWLVATGVLDPLALWRGLALALPLALGVMLGQGLFRPRFEPYYKPFCLVLLLGLAGVSVTRTLI